MGNIPVLRAVRSVQLFDGILASESTQPLFNYVLRTSVPSLISRFLGVHGAHIYTYIYIPYVRTYIRGILSVLTVWCTDCLV